MPHLHYSPFQFATSVEVSTDDVSARRLMKAVKSLTKKDHSKTHDMRSTMPCGLAESIPGSPNAFISPNPVGTMKDMGKPLAPTGLTAPKSSVKSDGGHYQERHQRNHYGDRGA